MEKQWYGKSIESVFEALKSQEEGLSEQEALSRITEYGENKLPESKPDRSLTIFFRQFKSPLIYILILAGVVIFSMGEFVDGFIILGVLVFNAIIGALQEGKAQNTLLSLKKYTGAK